MLVHVGIEGKIGAKNRSGLGRFQAAILHNSMSQFLQTNNVTIAPWSCERQQPWMK